MEWGTAAAVVSAAVAVAVAMFASFRYIVGSIQSAREAAAAMTDKQAALDSRARHDLANSLTTTLTRFDNDIERLKRETVRRDEMNALETRLQAGQGKIESKVDKLDEKIDRLLLIRQ